MNSFSSFRLCSAFPFLWHKDVYDLYSRHVVEMVLLNVRMSPVGEEVLFLRVLLGRPLEQSVGILGIPRCIPTGACP